ncbi:MAG: hypothetical protein LGB68_05890, partial [Sulfurovum sp.]|nr:hypothetical protein [Sulfurovum sp.]
KHFDHENLAHSAVSNTPSKDILTSPSSIPNIFRSNEDEGCSISFDITPSCTSEGDKNTL